MKKTLLVLLASSLLVNANNYKEASKKELISKEIKKHSNDLKDSPKAVGIAMQETIKALALIQQNKLKDAQKILEDAYAKFNKVLKNNPKLTLIPLDEEIMVFQIEGDSKTIKKAIDLSLNLLKNYDTQVARDILMPLKDEIDINIISLPMNLYPKAIKEAIEALKKDNKNLAINNLKKAFSTLLLTRAVIPIPLLIAQDLIKGASTINDNDKEKAIALLQKAKD
ncbi:MAG: YfdX family protein, partial [Epsilonproteobacteria bacterium]|nr:YfdX family protein [Campylobacterota bacterium]